MERTRSANATHVDDLCLCSKKNGRGRHGTSARRSERCPTRMIKPAPTSQPFLPLLILFLVSFRCSATVPREMRMVARSWESNLLDISRPRNLQENANALSCPGLETHAARPRSRQHASTQARVKAPHVSLDKCCAQSRMGTFWFRCSRISRLFYPVGFVGTSKRSRVVASKGRDFSILMRLRGGVQVWT